jgi:hypothetical protein
MRKSRNPVPKITVGVDEHLDMTPPESRRHAWKLSFQSPDHGKNTGFFASLIQGHESLKVPGQDWWRAVPGYVAFYADVGGAELAPESLVPLDDLEKFVEVLQAMVVEARNLERAR